MLCNYLEQLKCDLEEKRRLYLVFELPSHRLGDAEIRFTYTACAAFVT